MDANRSLSYLIFTLGDRACAFSLEAVREVLPLPLLSRPPAMPGFVYGVMDLAGQAVPVIDLGQLLGLAPARESVPLYAPLLLLKDDRAPCAYLVDGVREIAQVSSQALTEIDLGTSFHGCVKGQLAATATREAISVLSPEKLLLELEAQALGEFARLTERRTRKAAETVGR